MQRILHFFQGPSYHDLISFRKGKERERKENFVPLKEERLEVFFFSCNACEVNEMSRNVGFLSGIG